MLPFTHSAQSNKSYNPVAHLVRRSTRSYDNSTNYYNKAPPTCPQPQQFPNVDSRDQLNARQSFRPLHEQVLASDLSNIAVPFYIPPQQHLPPTQYPPQYSQSFGPPSPNLCQVLTVPQSGSNAYCYGKEKVKISRRPLLLTCLLVFLGLMAIGIIVVHTFGQNILFESAHTACDNCEFDTQTRDYSNIQESIDTQTRDYSGIQETINETVEKDFGGPPEIITNFIKKYLVIHSVDEDYETTVEVIN